VPPRPAPRRAPAGYLILGEDSYLRERLREELIEERVPAEARAMAVARFDLGESPLAEVLRQAAAPSLFSPCQVLVLQRADALREADLEELEAYWEAPADFTVLVFEAERLDGRTRAARLLQERCRVLAADSPDDRGALASATRYAAEKKLELRPEAAEDLVFAVGPDQGRLRMELDKLAAYAGKGGQVTAEDVAAVVSPARQFQVFELADLLAEGRRAEALRLVRRLLEAGEQPVGVVGMLAWLYRQLLQARAFPPGTPVGKAAQTLRPRSRVEALLRQARRFHPEELRAGFAALLEADVALKSSVPDAAAVLETLVLRLTAPGEKKEGGPSGPRRPTSAARGGR